MNSGFAQGLSIFAHRTRAYRHLRCMFHLRIEISTVDNDEILQPALHEDVALGVYPAEIAGAQKWAVGPPRHNPKEVAKRKSAQVTVAVVVDWQNCCASALMLDPLCGFHVSHI